jgi:thiol-disulfide isomerase/thioredoxin
MNRSSWWLGGFLGLALGAGCGGVQPVPVELVQIAPVKAQDVLRLVHEPGTKAVLVNVWATWCGPCREEFPNIVKLARNYQARGLRVVLVSSDDERELPGVKQFLAKQGVAFPSYIKAEKDQEFINGIDSRWSGALPATFIYDGSGKLRHFWEGAASYGEFKRKVLEILNG